MDRALVLQTQLLIFQFPFSNLQFPMLFNQRSIQRSASRGSVVECGGKR